MIRWSFVVVPVTESLNHRNVEAGKHLWRLFSPTALLKQSQLQQIAQDCVQLSSEYLHGWRLHNLSRQSVPWFNHSHDSINHSDTHISDEFCFGCENLVPQSISLCSFLDHLCQDVGLNAPQKPPGCVVQCCIVLQQMLE